MRLGRWASSALNWRQVISVIAICRYWRGTKTSGLEKRDRRLRQAEMSERSVAHLQQKLRRTRKVGR